MNYTDHQPSDDQILSWAGRAPAGWAVACGGPLAVVVLDVEAPGMRDSTTKGETIRAVLAELPEHCKRPTPSGGVHAYLRVSNGPAPSARGCQLVRAERPAGARPALLAEYRGQAQIAVILGHGRGDLPPDFAPFQVTTARLSHWFDRLRAVSDHTPAQRRTSCAPGSPGSAQSLSLDAGNDAEADSVVAAFLGRVPGGDPCQWMREAADQVLKALATDRLHPAILGPVLQMVRGASTGHQGLEAALQELRMEFLPRVATRAGRPGGTQDAELEWDRALAGAIARVSEQRSRVQPTSACDCWLDAYLPAYDSSPVEARSRSGRARATDRVVVDYLLGKARLQRARVVRQAQRQISQATDLPLARVSAVVARLCEQGWITRKQSPGAIDRLELTFPSTVTRTTEEPTGKTVGSSVVLVPKHGVHRLFGTAGNGPGAEATFALLPHWRWPLRTRSGFLVRVTPGSASAVFAQPPATGPRRGIPAAPAGRGKTVRELAEESGVPASTIRGRLSRLKRDGLAFRDLHGRWWRYLFDPDWLADALGIPDTAHARKLLYDVQRRTYYDRLVENERVRVEDGEDGSALYVEVETGAVLWIDREPPPATGAPPRPS
ncbi:hypothetical protein BJ986_002294 [Phycicoccus badiiscoriae]|uniref:DNA primase/polymerase bifunctional N-terminal domain-containing protein n=1 Tax=Pedococcus badiiscoriae TaxID=642776 RepID=A0A852WEZ5_9MICO|nr:bifunctional DNA primase/polymerase [Pedococcus badiiscoriae]NYG07807.1 hypothetical protein [Pedococcus badiiscoriae]